MKELHLCKILAKVGVLTSRVLVNSSSPFLYYNEKHPNNMKATLDKLKKENGKKY